jgi:hypothetical protein
MHDRPDNDVLKRFLAIRERALRGEGEERTVAAKLMEKLRKKHPDIDKHADAWRRHEDRVESMKRKGAAGAAQPPPFVQEVLSDEDFEGFAQAIRNQRKSDTSADAFLKRPLWDALEWLGRKADEGLADAGFSAVDPGPWAKDRAPTADNKNKQKEDPMSLDKSNPFYRAVVDGDIVGDFCVELIDKKGNVTLEPSPEDQAEYVSIEVVLTIEEWVKARESPKAFMDALLGALFFEGDDEDEDGDEDDEDEDGDDSDE